MVRTVPLPGPVLSAAKRTHGNGSLTLREGNSEAGVQLFWEKIAALRSILPVLGNLVSPLLLEKKQRRSKPRSAFRRQCDSIRTACCQLYLLVLLWAHYETRVWCRYHSRSCDCGLDCLPMGTWAYGTDTAAWRCHPHHFKSSPIPLGVMGL